MIRNLAPLRTLRNTQSPRQYQIFPITIITIRPAKRCDREVAVAETAPDDVFSEGPMR